jgi:hypothetical protein
VRISCQVEQQLPSKERIFMGLYLFNNIDGSNNEETCWIK